MKKIREEDLISGGKLEFLAKQVVEGFITGLHKSPFHGFSVEFAEHRQYNPGDNLRNVDWKLLARTDKFYVKRFEEETNLRCKIILDVSSSMFYPKQTLNKINFSILAAASILQLLKKQRDAAGLSFIGNDLLFDSAVKSSNYHYKALFSELEKVLQQKEGSPSTDLATNIHHLAEKAHKRSLFVIFSDMLDAPQNSQKLIDALRHLKYFKHEIIIFNTLDTKTELDFEFENRPYTFIDTESQEKVKLYPQEIKEKYTKKLNENRQLWIDKCNQYKINLVNCNVSLNLEQILLPFLAHRKKMN